jgi:hypothetical protein
MTPKATPFISFRALLLAWAILALSQSARGASITDPVVSGDAISSGTLIDSDPNGIADRSTITVAADITWSAIENGLLRITCSIVDGSGVTMGSESTSFSATAGTTSSHSLDVTMTSRLDPQTEYYGRVRVSEIPFPFTSHGAKTAPTGFALYHFNSTDPNDARFNVIAEVDTVVFDRSHIVETMSSRDTATVDVDFTLWRYDDWDDFSTPGMDDIEVSLEVAMFEQGTNTPVPLVQTTFPTTVEDVIRNENAFFFLVPTETTDSLEIEIDPVGQLNVNKQYYVTVTISHEEEAGQPYMAGNTATGAATRILHFDGSLFFGSIATTFTTIVNTPTDLGAVGPARATTLRVSGNSGSIDGFPTHKYGDGSSLSVLLFSDGHAELSAGSTTAAVPANDTDELNDVGFRRFGLITLSTSGAQGNLDVTLPPGFGWASAPEGCELMSEVVFSNYPLNQNLQPASATLKGGTNPAYYMEETKPIWMRAPQIQWVPSQGQFLIDVNAVIYTRTAQTFQLKDFEMAGLLDNSDGALKRSNDDYYRKVTVLAGTKLIEINASGPNGSAEVSAQLDISPGVFVTHFPHDSTVSWTGNGQITYDDDRVVPATSFLTGADPIAVQYTQSCPPPEECAPAETIESFTFTPTGNTLNFTPEGGLHSTGSIAAGQYLRWGYIDSMAAYVHEFDDAFASGNFMMSGHFLKSTDNSMGIEDEGPAVIHLTGYDPSDLTLSERPGTAVYDDGFADYAGLNFRCLIDSDYSVSSVLAGTAIPGIAMKGICKYYARRSGVTGIHDPIDGGFPNSLQLYGYDFTFSNFGLNYLSNKNCFSLTDGTVVLPYPSDFTQEFESMTFTCLGNLDEAKVPSGSGMKELDYWESMDFDVFAVNFEADAVCDPSAGGYLVLGTRAYASHIADPLYGSLGVHPDGQIIRPSDGANDITSRYKLPSVVTINGPAGQGGYQFTPTEDAYLNHEESFDAGRGFWNVIGAWDVPFFEDLQVHLHLNTLESDTSSQIFVMGGWPSDEGWLAEGLSPSEDTLFDENHDGFPTGIESSESSSLDRYRRVNAFLPADDPGEEEFLVRAQQEFLGVVPFDYPLEWSSTLRRFKSSDAVFNDLLVLNVEHQIDYLSAEEAEISFGAQYGIPDINLANFTFNAVDENLGILESFTQALGQQLFDQLEGGVDSFSELMADEADRITETLITELLDEPVDQFVSNLDSLRAASNLTVPNINAEVAVFCAQVKGDLTSITDGVSAGANQFTGIVEEIDARLAAVEEGIDAIIGQVGGDPNIRFLAPDVGGDRDKLRDLILQLVADLATDYASLFANEILDELLAQAEPTISQIVTVLEEIKENVSEVRDELAGVSAFVTELDDIATAEIGNLQNEIDLVCAEVLGLLTTGVDLEWNFDDYTLEEWKEQVKQLIRDRFYASDYIADVQEAINEWLAGLESSMREAIDTAFAEVREIIREVISDSLAEVDKELNGMLDTLQDLVGQGQIDGYARINGDSLEELRLDGQFQWKAPDELEFGGYLRILALDSDSDGGCAVPTGDSAVEVMMGATEVPLGWLGQEATCNVGTKFVFAGGALEGMGGSFEVNGALEFETMVITEFGASVMFGSTENYIAAVAGLEIDSVSASGGIFFGKTCTADPLILVNADFEDVLGAPSPSFTGAYVYGEAWFPIYGGSCVFNISAGVGAGVFYFVEGPTYGGQMLLGVSGEALCVVSIKGSVELIGVKSGSDYAFKGTGTLSGKAGACPFCVKFSKSVSMTYTTSGGWKADY